ncbi:MAG TPA: 2-amino-5-formylamino-6-ribosylaminopyrimidin-4(3H)-one 5'-monophosphate deformylase [Methanobacteriaceae archaeon]|jgi:2-amino-5-formylamino-6-ribosylaminopyrimidin-4(3H)-one 5'-monophosphate deformylase|nr:2-amino-5-formylamino-6-ribosylaminopyrimidin-4(3H)-one 5'-monophosphate deformylase [Euryarchaeota archaeon]HNR25330.1 2-amino-5-formylamino-6-ribosylaminopyrimidin-4(3H)-one 5'-monophosphate deformylase [Methanobacteriaceae archaeon]
MIKLRYSSGNIISPDVHKIGVLALGSHLENHGAALPIDTDSKIAAHVALQASLRTGAAFLGVLYAATEYNYVKHGVHLKPLELVEKQLKPTLRSAKKNLQLEKIILVNGHGGNMPIRENLKGIEEDLGLHISFNNRIVDIEGPHAGSGELSMGEFLGITDQERLGEHCDVEKYPEFCMIGLEEARNADEGIDRGARESEGKNISADPELGKSLLEEAIRDVVKDIKSLVDD